MANLEFSHLTQDQKLKAITRSFQNEGRDFWAQLWLQSVHEENTSPVSTSLVTTSPVTGEQKKWQVHRVPPHHQDSESHRRVYVKGSSFMEREYFMHTINRQLDQGRVVEITYYGSMLFQDQAFDLQSLHSSTLVGRRCQNNQVEYLLRNTYGSSCSVDPSNPYGRKQKNVLHSDVRNMIGDSLHNIGVRYSFSCKLGHIWVPDNSLRYHLRSLTWIE